MPNPPSPATPSAALSLLSSMATRAVLAELTAAWDMRGGPRLQVESVGGVDAARRVAAGERVDLVCLAADAIDALLADGHLAAGSRVDLMRSSMAVAVTAGAPRPAVDTEDALRRAVDAAPSIGYSTGPSGRHLLALFARWGVADAVAPRLVLAPPGVPVAQLVADGRAALGFQQASELMHANGVAVLGALPGAAAFVTVFAAARTPGAAAGAAACLAFLGSREADAAKRAQGMQPA